MPNRAGWSFPLLLAGILIAIAHGYFEGVADLLVNIPGFTWLLSTTITIAGYTIGGLTLLAILFLGSAVVIASAAFTESDDDSEMEYLGMLASGIRTGAAVGIILILYFYYRASFDSPVDLIAAVWWILPVALIGYFIFVYLEKRRQVASAGTAVNRTQRDVRRSFQSWSEVLIGSVALVFAAALAVVQGAFSGVSQFGDPLLAFAGEIAYLASVGIGYATMGGEFWGSWIIPELSALQWVAVTLIIGGIALVVRDT